MFDQRGRGAMGVFRWNVAGVLGNDGDSAASMAATEIVSGQCARERPDEECRAR